MGCIRFISCLKVKKKLLGYVGKVNGHTLYGNVGTKIVLTNICFLYLEKVMIYGSVRSEIYHNLS